MFRPSIKQVKRVFDEKNYVFHEGGKSYHLNVIGIRSEKAGRGKYKDTLMVIFTDDEGDQIPVYYACLICWNEGQYSEILQDQVENDDPELVYAENGEASKNNHDELLRELRRHQINLHSASNESEFFHELPKTGEIRLKEPSASLAFLVNMALKNQGNRFTYTLINEADFYPQGE